MKNPTPLNQKEKARLIQKLDEIDNDLGFPIGTSSALFDTESSFMTGQVGPDTQWGNAVGLLQVMPVTKQSYEKLYKRKFDVNNVDDAAALYRAIMMDNARMFEDKDDAIRAYYAGPNTELWGDKTEAYLAKVKDKRNRLFQTKGIPYRNNSNEDAIKSLSKMLGLNPVDTSGVEHLIEFEDAINIDANVDFSKKPSRKTLRQSSTPSKNTDIIRKAITKIVAPSETVPENLLGRNLRGTGMMLDAMSGIGDAPTNFLDNPNFTGLNTSDKLGVISKLEEAKADMLLDAYGLKKGAIDSLIDLQLKGKEFDQRSADRKLESNIALLKAALENESNKNRQYQNALEEMKIKSQFPELFRNTQRGR